MGVRRNIRAEQGKKAAGDSHVLSFNGSLLQTAENKRFSVMNILLHWHQPNRSERSCFLRVNLDWEEM
jgi:hypothetical protein